jgi:hypothetical protein
MATMKNSRSESEEKSKNGMSKCVPPTLVFLYDTQALNGEYPALSAALIT